MKVYVAAIFRKYAFARGVMHALELAGHECTSTWLRETEKHDSANSLNPMDEDQKRLIAEVDLYDVAVSDVVILLCEEGDVAGGTRGGRHFETGYATAHGIPVIAIGGPENVFHYLPNFHNVQSVTEAVRLLREMES